ncbi:MAG: LVIVD repeat-containing protein [Candidatus Brocadiales bacterium]
MKHVSLHGICRCEPRSNLQRGEPEAKQSQSAINTYIHKLTLSTFALLSICLFFAPALVWTGSLRSLQACSFTLLGSYDTPGLASDVYVSGSTAYVADWDGILHIIDVSNPEAPALLGSYCTPDNTWGVYVSDNRAYVADGYSGFHIIDVSNPEAPALLGIYDTPGWAYAGHVLGNRAYMVDCWGGFHINRRL